MKITVIDCQPMPVGQYVARVTKVEHEDGIYGPQIKWTFTIVQHGDYAGREIMGWTRVKGSTKGKFVKWAGICRGRAFQPGENIDTDKLVGGLVVLTITIKEKDDGTEFNKIDSIKPYIQPKQESETSSAIEDDEDPFGK